MDQGKLPLRPRALASLPPSSFTWQVHCPECGSETMDRVYEEDHRAVTVAEDRDDYEEGNPLGTRGGYVLVALNCPRGHRHGLVIANHKGCELVGVVPLDEK